MAGRFLVLGALLLPLPLAAATPPEALPRDPTGYIEDARAAIEAGEPARALEILEEGLREYPSYARMLYWKGVALGRLGRWPEAVRAFEAAAQEGGESEQLLRDLAQAYRQAGQKERAEAILARLPREPQAAPAGRWFLRAEPEPFGYDTNIIGGNSDTPLAREIGRESAYSQATVAAGWQRGETAAGVHLSARHYWSEPDASFAQATVYAQGAWPVQNRWRIYAGGARGRSWLRGEGAFLDETTLWAGPAYAWSERSVTLVDAGWIHSTWFVNAPDPQDRDGDSWWLRVRQRWRPAADWELEPWAAAYAGRTQGSDFDVDGWEVGVRVRTARAGPLWGEAALSWTSLDFLHANSLSATGRRRRDGVLRAELQLGVHAGPLRPFVRISYTNAQSNLDPFDYDRVDSAAGLAGIEIPW